MARGGDRPNSGPKKGAKYRPRVPKPGTTTKQKRPGKPPDIPRDITDAAAAENLTPLEYMLREMNKPTEPKERRDRLAMAAAPFCHPRKGEGAGKKDDKADRAKQAGSGKFAASAAPIRVVK
jgi:phage terminase small subunit